MAIRCEPSTPQQLAWVTLEAELHTDGLRDVRSLPVQLYAAREGNDPILLAERQVQVPGQGKYTLVQKWPPPEPGRWTVWVEIGPADLLPDGVIVGTLARLEVNVEPVALPPMFQPMQPFDGVRFTWPVALLVASIALAAVAILGLIVGRMGNAVTSEPRSEVDLSS